MIGSFRSTELQQLWEQGKELEHKTLEATSILDVLDVLNAASSPHDAAFIGFRFDEWTENNQARYCVMISDHWIVSYGWSGEHAIGLDLERID